MLVTINREKLFKLIEEQECPFWEVRNGNILLSEFNRPDVQGSIDELEDLLSNLQSGGTVAVKCYKAEKGNRQGTGGDTRRMSYEYLVRTGNEKEQAARDNNRGNVRSTEMDLLKEIDKLKRDMIEMKYERKMEDLEDQMEELKEQRTEGIAGVVKEIVKSPEGLSYAGALIGAIFQKMGMSIPMPVMKIAGTGEPKVEYQKANIEEQIDKCSNAITELIEYDEQAGDHLMQIVQLAKLSSQAEQISKEKNKPYNNTFNALLMMLPLTIGNVENDIKQLNK